jgi:glucan 1,3-beta-glucosidase
LKLFTMRFSTIIPVALAAAPALVSAAGSLCFALGDKNGDGTCKTQSDWAADFKAIGTVGSKVVRTYSASECDTAKEILPAAKAAGFKVILGVWYVPLATIYGLRQPSGESRHN